MTTPCIRHAWGEPPGTTAHCTVCYTMSPCTWSEALIQLDEARDRDQLRNKVLLDELMSLKQHIDRYMPAIRNEAYERAAQECDEEVKRAGVLDARLAAGIIGRRIRALKGSGAT